MNLNEFVHGMALPEKTETLIRFIRITNAVMRDERKTLAALKSDKDLAAYYGAKAYDAVSMARLGIEAKVKLGELLEKMPKNKGGRPSKTPRRDRGVSTTAERGLTKDEAAEARQFAKNKGVAIAVAASPKPTSAEVKRRIKAKAARLYRKAPLYHKHSINLRKYVLALRQINTYLHNGLPIAGEPGQQFIAEADRFIVLWQAAKKKKIA